MGLVMCRTHGRTHARPGLDLSDQGRDSIERSHLGIGDRPTSGERILMTCCLCQRRDVQGTMLLEAVDSEVVTVHISRESAYLS